MILLADCVEAGPEVKEVAEAVDEAGLQSVQGPML